MADLIAVLSPAPTEAQPQVIEMLENLLARARTGEVLSFAVACELTGREVMTGHSEPASVFALIGAVEHLKQRLLRKADDE